MSKYIFGDWKDVKYIKEKLNKKECELLDDILRNSKLIDNRPEDFLWNENNYGCDTGYDLYYNGYFIVETIPKYEKFKMEVLTILLVAEDFENISYLIEDVQEIFLKINKSK